MRTLEWKEVEQVSGGALPLVALVPMIQAVTPVVTTIVTAGAGAVATWMGVSAIKDAIDKAATLCKEGASATVKSPVVDVSCSGKKDEQSTPKQDTKTTNPPPGVLRAMMPDFFGA
ncbi:MAG: hypothetical protein RI988_2778 [Pseudomonadota bacterium]|jgi:hypothetical protein